MPQIVNLMEGVELIFNKILLYLELKSDNYFRSIFGAARLNYNCLSIPFNPIAIDPLFGLRGGVDFTNTLTVNNSKVFRFQREFECSKSNSDSFKMIRINKKIN